MRDVWSLTKKDAERHMTPLICDERHWFAVFCLLDKMLEKHGLGVVRRDASPVEYEHTVDPVTYFDIVPLSETHYHGAEIGDWGDDPEGDLFAREMVRETRYEFRKEVLQNEAHFLASLNGKSEADLIEKDKVLVRLRREHRDAMKARLKYLEAHPDEMSEEAAQELREQLKPEVLASV